MAKRVRDRNLETKEARTKLKARGKPYWQGDRQDAAPRLPQGPA